MYSIHWLKNRTIVILLLGVFGLIHCENIEESGLNDDNKLLAAVFNKKLFYSEIADLIPLVGSEDSIVAVNSAINRWIKKSLLMREAERNIPKDLNIEELINNYRESLILHSYEQLLVDQNLDTTITQDQYEKYYETNKSQYILKYTIIKGYFFKFPKGSKGVTAMRKVLKENEPNIAEIKSLIIENGVPSIIDPNKWIKALDLIAMAPDRGIRIGDLTKGRLIELNSDEEVLLIKVLNKVPSDDLAPLSYIEDQIGRIILHERKNNLLKDINEKLYEQELRNNNIKIYSE